MFLILKKTLFGGFFLPQRHLLVEQGFTWLQRLAGAGGARKSAYNRSSHWSLGRALKHVSRAVIGCYIRTLAFDWLRTLACLWAENLTIRLVPVSVSRGRLKGSGPQQRNGECCQRERMWRGNRTSTSAGGTGPGRGQMGSTTCRCPRTGQPVLARWVDSLGGSVCSGFGSYGLQRAVRTTGFYLVT